MRTIVKKILSDGRVDYAGFFWRSEHKSETFFTYYGEDWSEDLLFPFLPARSREGIQYWLCVTGKIIEREIQDIQTFISQRN